MPVSQSAWLLSPVIAVWLGCKSDSQSPARHQEPPWSVAVDPNRSSNHHNPDDERAYELATLVRALHVLRPEMRSCIDDEVRRLWTEICHDPRRAISREDLSAFDSLKGSDFILIYCDRAFMNSGVILRRDGQVWRPESR